MASYPAYVSDLEHHKLNAHVYPGHVIERYFVSDPNKGLRRKQMTTIWKVERQLGKGGSGEVRLEVRTDEQAEEKDRRAVKRIWTSSSNLRKEYERELKALLEFSKPKYKEAAVFVEFWGWFEDHDSVYLAMEYMPHGDLEDNIPPKGEPINEWEIREIASQILEGLRFMHQEGFIHQDLKPKVSNFKAQSALRPSDMQIKRG
jgi:serine/threonine protein kinase